MSTSEFPDYALEEVQVVTEPRVVKAIFDPLRGLLLELLLERAASVQELAAAVDRPRSSIAYHVKVLHEAGVLQVVRTRMVRGREESFYGRTARLFSVGDVRFDPGRETPGFFETAAREAAPAIQADDLRGLTRYAWIDREKAAEFWDRVMELVAEYGRLPRTSEGTRAYALLTAMYPTDHPRLAPPDGDGDGPPAEG
ncbi:ArsR family transcriptional regulator [Brachybacterium endophyticum]|uniref:ArsR family transcriptional regulator n=1 Tax=Brachybacterium endophyticum TaxID=2182385 RepID=A0A2U2RJH4_9MICO|nr:helix-turn-helix domain-containing protein [Brachybacterium endophyticum]PWH06029.1 ArsR family transcriptional regulator [Brachybacterium endophyticum]